MFLVGALIALAGGMGVYELHFRTDHRSTPIGLDAALDEFQASASSSLPGGSPSTELPAPGVYSYSTTGNDGVDALGGALHRYPATSTIIVTAAECGVSQRWAPLEQRADETLTCATADGVEVRRFTAFHQFFGQDEREEWECTGEPRPLDAAPGTTWTTECTKQRGTDDVGSVDTWSGVVVGPETATVEGETVDVDHVTRLHRHRRPSRRPGDRHLVPRRDRPGGAPRRQQLDDERITARRRALPRARRAEARVAHAGAVGADSIQPMR